METYRGEVQEQMESSPVGALDGKHVAIKKTIRFGMDFYNCKVFFLVLLALVDTEYRFLWVHFEVNGWSSDAQIFNWCKLKKRYRMALWDFHHLNPFWAFCGLFLAGW